MRRRNRQFGATQIVGVITAALGLLFVIAFGAKVLEAYRLRNWSERLRVEVDLLVREQADWQSEVQRRQGTAWIEEELGRIGLVRDDQVRIVAKAVTPVTTTTITSTPTTIQAIPTATAGDLGLFRNANWRAWRRLIGGFD
jgi:hypothetical protein